jgi:hypothetical protein
MNYDELAKQHGGSSFDPTNLNDVASMYGGTPVQEQNTDTGFTGALKSSIEGIKAEGYATLGRTGLMNVDEAEKQYKEHKQKSQDIFKPTEEGWTQAPVTKFKELLGGSAAYMALPFVAGAAATLAPEVALAGGLISGADLAAGAAGFSQFVGTNLSRQMDEGSTLEHTNLLAAGLAAVPQAALDTVGFHMIPGVRKIFGEAGIKIGDKEAADVAKSGIAATIGSYVKQGVKTAGIEGVNEAAQQVFERLQAGLNLTDEDARKEYYENFLGGAVLGSVLAVPGHAIESMGQPKPTAPGSEAPAETPIAPQANQPTSAPVTQAGIAPIAAPVIPQIPEITTTPTGMATTVPTQPASQPAPQQTQSPAQPAAQPPIQPPVAPTPASPTLQASPTGTPIEQNRDRSTPASVAQMQSIAAKPIYDLVGPSKTISGSGAPIVTSPKLIPQDQVGKIGTAYAENGTRIPFQYGVVEAKDILPSHNADGSVNPQYGPDHQGIRAVVGNGRTAGIQEAFRKGTADQYVNELKKDESHGIDPKVIEKMKEPVLVRWTDPKLLPANIGDISNTSGTMNLSVLDQAKNDSQRVDLNGLQFDDKGNVTNSTLNQFVNSMPVSERAGLSDENGQPNKQSRDRLNAAIFHSVYQNDSLTNLAHQADDEEAVNVLKGLSAAAPQMNQLADSGEYDIRPAVAQAAQLAVNARRNGIKLSDLVNQQDITALPHTNDILQLFADNPRSARKIADGLKDIATELHKEITKPAEGLFGVEPKRPVSDIIKDTLAPKPDLFGKPTETQKQPVTYQINKTKEQIHDEIIGLKDHLGLAQWVVNNAPNKFAKAIAEKVLDRIKEFKALGLPMSLDVLDGPRRPRTWRGLSSFNPKDGSLKISFHGLDNNGKATDSTGTRYSTILHELIHSVSQGIFYNSEYAKKYKKTDLIHKSFTDMTKLLTAVRKQVKQDTLLGPNQRHQAVSEIINGKDYTKNIHELLTYGLTDEVYQDYLSTIKVGKKTAYSKLIDIIRNLLGIAPEYESALDRLMSITDNVFEPSGKDILSAGYNSGFLHGQRGAFEEYDTADKLTKIASTPKAGKQIKDAATNVFKNIQDDQYRSGLRIAIIDKNAGLAAALGDQPIFDMHGQLRADMLARTQDQMVNLIHSGLQTGTPDINLDGTLGIVRSDKNLSRSQILADKLDGKIVKDGQALSGRQALGLIARILRGKDIINEDAMRNAKGKAQLDYAKALMKDVQRLRNEKAPISQIKQHLDAIKYLRKEGYLNKNLQRELQVTPEQIKWADAQLKNPQVKEILDIWKDVNHSLVTLWEKAGLFTKEQADLYRSQDRYVPLFKSREDLENGVHGGYGGSGAKSVKELKKLRGSEAVRNIWENMDKHYASMVAAAYQNQTRKIATEQLAAIGSADFVKSSNPDVNLRYRDPTNPHADENGIVSAVIDNPNTLAAFQMMHYELGPIMKAFAATTKVLRAGALINPMYWVKQLIRDPIHASLVADSGIITPFHAIRDYMQILSNNSPEARILASRGVIGQVDSTVDIHDFLKTAGKERNDPKFLQKAIHKIMQMHEASDAATRVSIYKKAFADAKSRGLNNDQATNFSVHKARESINFSVHGNSPTLNAIRHMIPFVSAQITSLDSVYRAATGKNLSPKEKAAARAAFRNAALVMTMTSLAYAWAYSGDDDYNKLADTVKDNNWLIPNPMKEHTFIKIPIPFEVGFLFKSVPEASTRYLMGNSTGREVLKSYALGLANNLPANGIPIPQAGKPILENITNYSFFTGRPIEGMSDQGLPVENRGAKASELAKILSHYGGKNIGLSPAKIDNLIQGYTAELGTFSNGIASSAIMSAEGKEAPTKNAEEMEGLKSFMTNPNSSKAVADFYELDHNANELYTEFNNLKKAGQGKQAQEFLENEENKKQYIAAPALRKIQSQMTNIHAQINMIQNNQKLDPEERRIRVNQLEQNLDKVARQGYKIADSLGLNR